MKIPQQQCDKCDGSGKIAIQDGLGVQMRSWREKHKISLRAIAREMEKSATFISYLEVGRESWSSKNITAYLQAIDKCKTKEVV